MCSMQLIPSHLEELVEVDLVGTMESSHLTHSAMRRPLQEEVSLLNFGLDFLHGTITSLTLGVHFQLRLSSISPCHTRLEEL